MDLATYITLDRDGRSDARDAATRALVDLYLAEVAIRLHRVAPAANHIRIYVHGGLRRFVDLVRVEDVDGVKVRKPRPGIVEQIEGLLSYVAHISLAWPSDKETVVELPDTVLPSSVDQPALPAVDGVKEPVAADAGGTR